MKRIIIDLDDTITVADSSKHYSEVEPRKEVIEKIREYKALGFEIAIHSSRNMQTHQNSVGKITAQTVPIISEWLEKHEVPFDEIWIGKPWCGEEGFYVDDKSIRPKEFVEKTYEEILEVINDR